MFFRAIPLRFQFRAVNPLRFPQGKAANTFRGALGLTLRAQRGYARIFEPRTDTGPSGLHDQPRPFVLRAAALDGKSFLPHEIFDLEVIAFDLVKTIADDLAQALAKLRQDGLGPERAKVELIEVSQSAAVEIPFECSAVASRIRIDFRTPTELKSNGQTIREPRFDVVLARARDRVSSICSIYQGVTAPFDFVGTNERAKQVRITECSIRQIHIERRSSRTGQVHSLGGFVGTAEYEGELNEFLPILRAAEWTGVGRLTVWGNGRIVLQV